MSEVEIEVTAPAWLVAKLSRIADGAGITVDQLAAFLFGREVVHT